MAQIKDGRKAKELFAKKAFARKLSQDKVSAQEKLGKKIRGKKTRGLTPSAGRKSHAYARLTAGNWRLSGRALRIKDNKGKKVTNDGTS